MIGGIQLPFAVQVLSGVKVWTEAYRKPQPIEFCVDEAVLPMLFRDLDCTT